MLFPRSVTTLTKVSKKGDVEVVCDSYEPQDVADKATEKELLKSLCRQRIINGQSTKEHTASGHVQFKELHGGTLTQALALNTTQVRTIFPMVEVSHISSN